MRAPVALVGILFGALWLSQGCTSTSKQVAEIPQKPSPSETGLPYDGAPNVPNPVDVTRFKSAPCSVLTAAQLRQLGIVADPISEPSSPTGPSCTWQGYPQSADIAVSFTPDPDGLSVRYSKAKNGEIDVFQPQQPVNGFPAALDLVDDNRADGDCSYSVGVNNRDVLFVQLTEPRGGNPCDDARQVALSATKTIKVGG